MGVVEIVVDTVLSVGIFQSILSLALIFAITELALAYIYRVQYPVNLPRVFENEKATSFSWSTRLLFYTDCKKLFTETYETYSKKGKTVLMPGLGFRDEVIIPTEHMRWLASLPETVCSPYEAFVEIDQVTSDLPHDKFAMDPWPGNLVRKDINAILETIVEGLNDELQYAFDTRFGTDTENWKDIPVLDTMKLVVGQASSRFTVGFPLCRNDTYVRISSAFVDQFVLNAGVCGMAPIVLRPVIRPIMSITQRLRVSKMKALLKPIYEDRLKFLSSPAKTNPKEPQDHLQLMLRYAQANIPDELNLNDIIGRVAISNLGSYHQTTISVTNILFNLIASDAEYNTIAALREEFAPILKANGGKWTKACVAKMVKADSVCRETLRFQPFGGRALLRKIVAKEGVVTPDGITVPCGSMVSLLNWAAQTDSESFPDPHKFDPFRFSRERELQTDKDATPQTFVTTGPLYMTFGHGRHACPGRFLVDFEMKMILAYLVMNYDIKFPERYGGKRPENRWISEAIFPPMQGTIMFRRRRAEV